MIFSKETTRYKQEVELLFHISKTLNQSTDLREVVQPALEVLAQHWGMLRGTLTILNRQSGEIFIEVAYGLSDEELDRGRYKIGEGVTGKVVASGEPMVVPRISDDPQFLNRTLVRERMKSPDISFICVPIKFGSEVIGALSIDKAFQKEKYFEEDVRILSIIASMIARAVQIHQVLHEERQRLEEENARLHDELKDKFRPANIIGHSKGMMQVFGLIDRVSKTDTTVFIHGESGVGKELVAAAVHYNSSRADKPFIKVNCAALPENLIESELFGHEKGAFTGAIATQKGRFELAHEGTIFLDEIGDLSPSTQVKLLRVLQEREFERLGGRTVKVDVRVIAATNKKLETMVEEGEFRQDLYYRLNVFPLKVPALRERKTDIMPLADHFLDKYSKKMGVNIKRITTAAIDMIMSYHWPGNVRELENAMERAVLLSSDGVIHSFHLPPSLQTAESSDTGIKGTLNMILGNVERDIIVDALKSSRGNLTKAAKVLGITERIMGLRIKKYKMDPKRFR